MKVAMCCTRNWYLYLAVEVYALFYNNNVEKLYLFIEDDMIPYLNDDRIEYININKIPEYIGPSSPNYFTNFSRLSFTRCYFTKILNDDKILYIDADAIVDKNIEDLWNIDLGDKLIAGVKEPGEWSEHLGIDGLDDTYINSGVLLMDLKGIRDSGLDDELIRLLNEKKFAFPDQDAINIIFKDKIKYISNIYNSTEITGFRKDAKIIHYIRRNKGWIKSSPRSDIWYNYHKKIIEGGKDMDNYKVKALIYFDDYEGKEVNEKNEHKTREVGDEFYCSRERYEYLKANNAVELIEINKVELPEAPKKEEVKEEVVINKPKITKVKKSKK